MQRLAENREVDRAFRDRRILDVAEPVFQILEAVLLRQLRAELDHLRRVIDRDDFARVLRRATATSVPSPAPRSATVSGGSSAIKVWASACQERPGQ